MKTMKKSILGAALVAALGFGSAAQAAVIIDLFTDPPGGQSVTTSTLGATDFNQAGAFASILGGWRDLSIQKTFDNTGGVNTGASTFTADSGVLQLDNATGNRSIGVVTWDGNNIAGANGSAVNITGLAGADLTVAGADRFLADILAADLGFDYKITVWDMDGDKSVLSASVQVKIGGIGGLPPTTADFLYAWFNLASGTYCDGAPSGPPPTCADPANELAFTIAHTGGMIDFNNIGALQIEFNAVDFSADFAIGTIDTNETPEPGSLALAGIALVGAALSGRRRKSGQA